MAGQIELKETFDVTIQQLQRKMRYSRTRLFALVALFVAFVLFLTSSYHNEIRSAASSQLCDTSPSPPVSDQAAVPIVPVKDLTSSEPSVVDPDPFVNYISDASTELSRAQIHRSFTPKCDGRDALMEAMAGGGRHGFDQPYSALGCDLTWYTTPQVCGILSKFDRIHFVGDSLIRQIVLALHIIMREDLINGGRQSWRTDNPPDEDCSGRTLFQRGRHCFWWELIDTDDLFKEQPELMKCERSVARLSLELMQASENVPNLVRPWAERVNSKIEDPHNARNVYVFGAGSWNGYRVNDTRRWLTTIEDEMRLSIPSYFSAPRLWISPGAQAQNKHPMHIEIGNNIRIQHHVLDMDGFVKRHGFDHMRVYNLTVQASSPDGTHTSLENTLVEAMMLLNWLDRMADSMADGSNLPSGTLSGEVVSPTDNDDLDDLPSTKLWLSGPGVMPTFPTVEEPEKEAAAAPAGQDTTDASPAAAAAPAQAEPAGTGQNGSGSAEANTSETKSGQTQSDGTQSSNTQSDNTQSGNTQSGQTQSGNTQSSNTQSGNTQAGNTQSGQTQSDETRSSEPQPGQWQSPESQPGEWQSPETHSTDPSPAGSSAAGTDQTSPAGAYTEEVYSNDAAVAPADGQGAAEGAQQWGAPSEWGAPGAGGSA
ncbi:hypothetical protein FH972_021033 [Carpinus fangiana]|uniref:Uncharacterized protein n=1 Tax=Carpinus fangiana TaxID=176857 RepID=A0A5N6KND0_9ROSI|nr:hypothetical protein FH972_021033 [Carpinus fangiana]